MFDSKNKSVPTPPHFFWKRSRQENFRSFSSSINDLLNHCDDKSNGFTLAEVLITLVIIGVIAAITIPSLIAKYHDEQLKTQFKKTYSAFSQAINKVNMLDFNGQVNCYYPYGQAFTTNLSDCQEFFNLITKNLVLTKYCQNNAKEGGCVPKYSQYAIEGSGCGGYSEQKINNNNSAYVLASGQILINYSASSAIFVVDINGFKGPNKGGYDVFSFIIRKINNSGLRLEGDNCFPMENGGKTSTQMIRSAFAGRN
ncbi:prepilin-type N-terminal cleavage/methylation domain-containing protein [bacterium]|nr:prepilin-type N-terminal cleavage/methylation domain-containing protein [bacterium]